MLEEFFIYNEVKHTSFNNILNIKRYFKDYYIYQYILDTQFYNNFFLL